MEKDIEILVQQRKTRPVYARVISWEFSQVDEWETPTRRRHHSKRNRQKEEVKLKEESGSLKCSGNIPRRTSTDSTKSSEITESTDEGLDENLLVGDIFDDTEEEDEEEEVEEEEEDAAETAETQRTSEACNVGRRGKLSSRRKKKWHRRLNRFEYMAPYAHVDNLDFGELCNVKDSMAATDMSNSQVDKPVPTLVELCLRVNSLPAGNTGVTPPLLKDIIYHHHGNSSLRSIQLHWLHNMLKYYQQYSKMPVAKYKWLLANWDRSSKCYRYEHERLRRNIWDEEYFCAYFEPGASGTDILPYSQYSLYVGTGRPCVLRSLSVMASTINFMLPANIAHNYGCNWPALQAEPETVIINTATKNASLKLKRVLAERYPGCVQHFFEHALPYVWWARGNAEYAAEAFMKLVEKLPGAQDKALYLNEIGRLFVHFGWPEKALRYFALAAGQLTGTTDFKVACSYQLPLQTKMLCASALDSGVFTRGRCSRASRLWREVLSLTTEDSALVESAVFGASSSMMCVHAGRHSDTHSSFQEEMETQLQQLVTTHPQFYLHLSFLQAIQRKRIASLQFYQDYINKFAQHKITLFHNELPGQSLAPSTERDSCNVWQPLLDIVDKLPQRDVKVLSLVWRTQLCHPVFPAKVVPHVADYNAPNMTLWMTSDGDLTGDMSMILPPMEQIKLNPYTGLVRTSLQGQGMIFRKRADLVTDEFGPPKILQVYSNQADGISVSVIQSISGHYQEYIYSINPLRKSSVISIPCDCCVLQYTGRDNPKMKLDLKKLMKVEKRKEVEADIRKAYLKNKDDLFLHSLVWMKEMMECLDQYCARGWTFTFKVLSDVVYKRYQAKHPWLFCEKEKKKMSKNQSKKRFPLTPPPTLVSLQLERYWVVGRCLILVIFYRDDETYTTVVIDCSSAETFCKPNIILHKGWKIDLVTPDRSQDGSTSGVLMVAEKMRLSDENNRVTWTLPYECRRLLTYNNRGEMIREHFVTVASSSDPSTLLTCVIDSYMYGIHPRNDRIICDQLTQSVVSEKLAKTILKMTVWHKLLLLNTDKGLGATDKHMKPVIWRPCRKLGLTLSEDKQWLSSSMNHTMTLLADKTYSSGRSGLKGEVMRVLVAYSNHLLVLELPVTGKSDLTATEISIVLDIELAGWPTEACFISEQDGFIVTGTIFNEKDKYLQENLYQFTYDGCLQGVLPFLGRGPHSFYPVYLGDFPQTLKVSPEGWRPGWHLYFRDGYGAIGCMRVGID